MHQRGGERAHGVAYFVVEVKALDVGGSGGQGEAGGPDVEGIGGGGVSPQLPLPLFSKLYLSFTAFLMASLRTGDFASVCSSWRKTLLTYPRASMSLSLPGTPMSSGN